MLAEEGEHLVPTVERLLRAIGRTRGVEKGVAGAVDWSRSEKSTVLSSRGLKMTLPRISGAAITRQSQATNSGSRESWCGPSLPHQPAKVSLRLRRSWPPPPRPCPPNQAGPAAPRRPQPEAQHPNFPLSTSWQADYPIFAPKSGQRADMPPHSVCWRSPWLGLPYESHRLHAFR